VWNACRSGRPGQYSDSFYVPPDMTPPKGVTGQVVASQLAGTGLTTMAEHSTESFRPGGAFMPQLGPAPIFSKVEIPDTAYRASESSGFLRIGWGTNPAIGAEV